MRRLTTLLMVLALTCGLVAAASLTGTEVKIAREVDGPYALAGPVETYTQSVIRGVGNNFFLRVTLTNATFDNGSLAPTLTYTATSGDVSINQLVPTTAFTADSTFAEWHVIVIDAATTFPTFSIDFSPCTINATGIPGGGSVTATVDTRDANTNEPFDLPAVSDTIATGVWAIIGDVTDTTATIDVASDRKHFVPINGDTTLDDNGGAIEASVDGTVYDQLGNPIDATWATGANVEVTFSANLTSITTITINTSPAIVHPLTAAEKAAASLTLDVPLVGLMLNPSVMFTVDGVNPLDTRTLNVAMNLEEGTGNVDNGHAFQAATKITQWGINGTVLAVPWVNGNNAFLNSRIYLYNLSGITGAIRVKAKTLPRVGTASAELGTVNVGNLPANGTAMVKVAEDVLATLVTLPYVTDGGNIALEITIDVPNADGLFQSFNSGFGFGTTPVIVIATANDLD